MKTTLHSFMILTTVAAFIVVVGLVFAVPSQDKGGNGKRKTLREIGQQRDIEIELSDLEINHEYDDARLLAKAASAVVIGRLISRESSFSGDDHINTSYSVEVQRVIKDKTPDLIPILHQLGEAQMPLPLQTPLKIVHQGGVVFINGHRVSAKLKGSEGLRLNNDYILFLHWSRDHKAYYLAGGSSGAFLVNSDQTVHPLGSEKGMRKYDGITLELLISQLISTQ